MELQGNQGLGLLTVSGEDALKIEELLLWSRKDVSPTGARMVQAEARCNRHGKHLPRRIMSDSEAIGFASSSTLVRQWLT